MPGHRSPRTASLLTAALAGVAIAALPASAPAGLVPAASAAAGVRVELRVLLVTRGGPEEAVAAGMDAAGVRYTRVDLRSSGRPQITAGFLADAVSTGPRAKFQGVVLPDESPVELSDAERTALANYERTYGIRQIDAFTWAHPGVGPTTRWTRGSPAPSTAAAPP
jgi:hypothetical protein